MGNINVSKLKKSLASVASVSILFSNFLFLENAFAISWPSFTALETVSNVTSVSQVKASRTLTVNSIPQNWESLIIWSCNVTFNNNFPSNINCDDGTAEIYRSSWTNRSIIATRLRQLSDLLDTWHWTILTSGSDYESIFTTSWTETSATDITFVDWTNWDITSTSTTTWVVWVPAVAQEVTFTPWNTIVSWIKYRSTINGNNYDYTSTWWTTLSDILTSLQVSMDWSSVVSCTQDGTKITCTATPSWTPFTYNAEILDVESPVLTLNWSWTITQEFGSVYTDLWADWTDNVDWTWTISTAFSWTVDVNTLWTYVLEYKHTDSSSNVSNIETRTVEVVDTTSPTWVTVEYSTTWATNQDVIATLTWSNEALTWTLTHTFTWNTTYTFDYSDLFWNTWSIDWTVTWIDKENPVIILSSTWVTLEKWNTYLEEWVEWNDNVDWSWSFTNTWSFVASWSVDINTVWSYNLTYDYTDSAWNIAEQVTKTVEVVDTTAPIWTISYSQTWITNQDVISTLILSESWTITNNSWSSTNTFIQNWTFVYEYEDIYWNKWTSTWEVTWIDKISPNKVSTSINDWDIWVSPKSSSFSIEFDEYMQVLDDSQISLEKISSWTTTISLGKIWTKGDYLYINYDDLEYDTIYRLKINSWSVSDLAWNIYTWNIDINFTTQSSIAPTILTLSTSDISSTSAKVNYTTDITPDEREYKISTISWDGTWSVLWTSPFILSNLTPDTVYYYQLRFKKDWQTSYSQINSFKTSISDAWIVVTNQSSFSWNPIVWADFWSGYHFRLNVTINNLLETEASLKLADWSNWLTTIPVLANTKAIFSQNWYNDYSSALVTGNLFDVENNYLNYKNIGNIDADNIIWWRQVIIDLFYKIPLWAWWNYSTTYWINTREPEFIEERSIEESK